MIIIGNRVFKTQKEAERFIQEILYKYKINIPLHGDDLVFICDLIKCHPDKDSKIGIGIKSIIVNMDVKFNKTRHFSIVRLDDSIMDFSFRKCLLSNLDEPIKLFHSSARRAVADQIIYFRDNIFLNEQNSNGEIPCSITGILINKSDSHVDHIYPNTFYKIVSDFIKINNIDVNNTEFIEASDGIGREFADNIFKSTFSDYHRKVANLQIVSPLANLKQKKK